MDREIDATCSMAGKVMICTKCFSFTHIWGKQSDQSHRLLHCHLCRVTYRAICTQKYLSTIFRCKIKHAGINRSSTPIWRISVVSVLCSLLRFEIYWNTGDDSSIVGNKSINFVSVLGSPLLLKRFIRLSVIPQIPSAVPVGLK